MSKGIMLGLLMQVISTIGYLLIAEVTAVKNELLKASLTSCFAGVVALVIAAYLVLSGTEQLSSLGLRDTLYLAIGSALGIVVAQAMYFAGISASNLTTVAYTMLAYPVIAMIGELILGRVELASLTVRDFAGFALLVGGYVIMVSGN